MQSKAILPNPFLRKLSVRFSAMNYLAAMQQVLSWQGRGYAKIASANRALRYCVINVSLLGFTYGAGALYLSATVLNAKGAPAQFNPLMILMAGMSVAFLMHGGAALFFWVFSRGIGGNPVFLPIYLNLGVAALALVPLAPALAALQAGLRSGGLLVYTGAGVLYAAGVLYVAIRQAAGLAHWKMVLAASAAVIYIGCFLYLWT